MNVLSQLKRLPSPYKQLAIREHIKHRKEYPTVNNKVIESLNRAVDVGFIWSNSPQGHIFWGTIHMQLKNSGDDLSAVSWPKIEKE